MPAFDQLALELFALQFQHNAPYRRLARRGARALTRWRTGLKSLPCQLQRSRSSSFPACRWRSARRFSIPAARRHSARAGISTTPSRWRFMRPPCWRGSMLIFHWQSAIGNWLFSPRPPPRRPTPHWSTCSRPSDANLARAHRLSSAGRPRMAPGRSTWRLPLSSCARPSASGQPLLLLGTAFSYVHLLDHLAERDLRLKLPPGSCALETGGYKGRSRSLPKSALHALISQRLGIPPNHIVCEYGMSELSSQAYDVVNGKRATSALAPPSADVPFPLTPPSPQGRGRAERRASEQAGPRPDFARTRAAGSPSPQGRGQG